MKVQANNSWVLPALGIMFVGLKLTGHIDWSWWLVTLPFWGPLALVLGLAAALFCFALVASAASSAVGLFFRK